MSDMISGMSGTGGGDMMRMFGMATGLDVDGMVKKMLLGEKAKVNKVLQDKEVISWKQEVYRDVIKDVKELQDTYFSSSSKDNLTSDKAYSDFDINISDTNVVTALIDKGAIDGNYKVNVKNLARGATLKSGKARRMDGKSATVNTLIKDLGISSGENKIKIEFNDEKPVIIDIKEEDSIKDLLNEIKSETKGRVEGRFSELTQSFTFETKKEGGESKLNITEEKGTFCTSLGIDQTLKKGVDANLSITEPGEKEVEITRNSNNFTIDGVVYNLKDVGKTDISVTKNVDKTFDRIKGFLDKYNTLVDKINKKLTEKKDYDYKPLTEEQKKGMKDDEIKVWEEKAKKGILRNDENLENMLSELRGTLFKKVEGSNMTFNRSELGLDTSNLSSEAGQIKFSKGGEETLKKALMERPEDIMTLFNKTPGKLKLDGLTQKEIKEKIYNNSGINQRMDEIIKRYVGLPGVISQNAILTKFANKQEDYSITGSLGSNTLPDQIYRKDLMIKKLNKSMKNKEERLYKQFSRLEVIMNNYNSQAAWLSQQFGGQ